MSAENVGVATTLSLMRIRARDLRAEYTRMWRCYAGGPVQPFVYDSPEGVGTDSSRVQNLCDYIGSNVRRVEDFHEELMRSSEAKAR